MLRELVGKINIDGADAVKDLKSVDKGFDNLKDKLASSGKKFGDLSNKTNKLAKDFAPLSVAAGAALGMSVKSAVEWEDAFASVSKTWRGSSDDLAIMQKNLQDMAVATGTDRSVLAGIAADAGQLGVTGVENVTKFTKTMADLEVATNITADQSIEMAQIMNILGEEVTNIDRLGSAFVMLGNNAKTTERDVFNMASRLGSTGKLVGMTTTDILGLSTQMTSLGISAESGGTAISKTMQSINTAVTGSTDELAGFARLAGVSAGEFAKQWRDKPLEAFSDMLQGLDDIGKAGGDVAGTLSSLGINNALQIDALQRMSSGWQDVTHYADMANDAYQKNNALSEESAVKYQTTKAQINQAKEALKGLAGEIGATLTPAIGQATDIIKSVTDKLSQMSPETKEVIGKIVLGFAALAPAFMIVSKIFSGIQTAIGMFNFIAPAIEGIGAAIGVLGGPATLIIGILVGGAILIATHWEETKAIIASIGAKFSEVKNTIVTNYEAIKQRNAEMSADIKARLGGAFNSAKSTALAAINGIKSGWETLKATLSKPIKAVVEIGNNIKGAVGGVMGRIKAPFIGSHAKGLDTVPYDNYPALLHKGETVLPASTATEYRGLGGTINRMPQTSTTNNTSSYAPVVNITINGNADNKTVTDIKNEVREAFNDLFRDLRLQRA